MPHDRRLPREWKLAPLARAGIAAIAIATITSACSSTMLARTAPRANDTAPVIDRAAASSTLITSYLEGLQKLALSSPAQQAEIVAAAQREYDLAPTASHQLRLALMFATPGHGATDLSRAQRLLRELMAAPAALLPAERALAFLEQQKVDSQIALAAENRRLQISVARTDKDRATLISRRLQTEMEENARLRKELEAAQAKLDAISDIERSLSERKPSAESRTP